MLTPPWHLILPSLFSGVRVALHSTLYHDRCDQSVENAYSFMAPDPTFAIFGGPCCPTFGIVYFGCGLWLRNFANWYFNRHFHPSKGHFPFITHNQYTVQYWSLLRLKLIHIIEPKHNYPFMVITYPLSRYGISTSIILHSGKTVLCYIYSGPPSFY
jgi:hypothetical protein